MQPTFLCGRGGNNQLANNVVDAELVEQMAAGNAQLYLERSGRVVKPGVDNFTVARACFAAERVMLFEDHRIDTALGQRACAGQTDNPGPDHDSSDSLHPALLRINEPL